MRNPGGGFSGALALALSVYACAAQASFYEHWGVSPRGVAMAGALTADATDFTAAFYNPAMLVLRKDVNFGLGVDYTRTDATVTPATLDKDLDCAYCDPLDWAGEDVGLLFPMGGKVKNRLALGLQLHLPSARLLSTRAPDPNRPFWYVWNNDPDRIEIFLGLGIRLTDTLTMGVGTQALADLVGNGATVRVDLFSKDVKFREIDSHLATSMGPVAGLYFAPTDALHFGVSWRSEMRLFYRIPADITLEGIGQLKLDISGYNHYSPHSINGGVSWDVTPELTLNLDGSYQMWSRAPSPYVRIAVDMSGDTLKALGLDEALDMDTQKQDPATPGFKDTFVTRFGVEYRVSDRFSARGGAWYRPTMVPRQIRERTNIMDSNTLGTSLGLGWSFDDPLEVFQAPIIVDLAVQALWLLDRTEQKDDTDPVPTYSHQMRVFGTSAMVRYNF